MNPELRHQHNTLNLELREVEATRLREYAKRKGMSPTAILREALRVYDRMEQTPGAYDAVNALTQAQLGPKHLPQAEQAESSFTDDPCTYWWALVREVEPLIDRRFRSPDGKVFTFFGLVHGGEDCYYGMWSREERLRLLSCAGSIEGHGYVLLPEEESQAADVGRGSDESAAG